MGGGGGGDVVVVVVVVLAVVVVADAAVVAVVVACVCACACACVRARPIPPSPPPRCVMRTFAVCTRGGGDVAKWVVARLLPKTLQSAMGCSTLWGASCWISARSEVCCLLDESYPYPRRA